MTSKKTAVNDALLYFPDYGLLMNYKDFALLLVIIVMISSAGCTGLSSGSVSAPGSPTEITQISTSNSRLMAEDKVVPAVSGGSAAIPVPTLLPTAGHITRPESTRRSSRQQTLPSKSRMCPVRWMPSRHWRPPKEVTCHQRTSRTITITNSPGTVTIRIPQAGFDNAIAGAKALGAVRSISTSGQDVTEEYVDLRHRKHHTRTGAPSANAIMKQSTTVEDILKVQEQIDQVQTQLDQLNGRLNYLNNRIDLATITVNLQEPNRWRADRS